MSELKFACPVCGQHITADSSSSGNQLECPTCFRKLTVPTAGALSDTKLVVAAALADRPREPMPLIETPSARPRSRSGVSLATTGVFLAVAGLCAAGIYTFRDKLFGGHSSSSSKAGNSEHGGGRSGQSAAPIYPIPTNFSWTLDLTNAPIPQTAAAGGIRRRGFYSERASLTGGTLTLRQGRNWPPDLGVSVVLFAKQGEDLAGKTVEIWTNRPGPVPPVILRWKDEDSQARTQTYTNGYAMKIVFGDAANGRIPGRLYLCLPDEPHSFVAGVFDAEIRKPPTPKPRPSSPAPPPPQTKR